MKCSTGLNFQNDFQMVDESDDDEKAILSILSELDQVPCPSGGKTVPLPAGDEPPEPITETEGIPFWAKCLAGATGIGKGPNYPRYSS